MSKHLLSDVIITWFIAIILTVGIGWQSRVNLPAENKRGCIAGIVVLCLAIGLTIGQVSGVIPLF